MSTLSNMKIFDIIKTSQTNLLRSKLRTFLTIGAVFIGALTLSLTNGVGNGIRSYVDKQLGNVGAEDTLIVRVKQPQQNPLASEVNEYDPETQIGTFNISLLDQADIDTITSIEGVKEVIPFYMVQIDYVTANDDTKYVAVASQNIEGVNFSLNAGVMMKAGEVNSVAIPQRYVSPLGFASAEDAIGKTISLGFKDAAGNPLEKPVKVAAVLESSLLGNSDIIISSELARKINVQQTADVPTLANKYMNAFVSFNSDYTPDEIQSLKDRLDEKGYAGQTIQDQIGTVGKVIDTILIVLNIFGIITLLAAAFGIVNTQLMSVNERTSEIGLMKALGAGRKTIFTIFSMEAASIGFWGAVLGTLMSIAIGSVASSYASKNFLKDFVGFELLTFPPLPTIGVIAAIMFLSFLAGALPSLKASRLDPIKALRYE